jgi:DNA polymerase-1
LPALLEALSQTAEISFDTETTGIDANNAQLVGVSFAVRPHHGWYVPLPPDNMAETKMTLARFQHLFSDEGKTWIGHNIKYDLLMLKWYGVQIKAGCLTPCWRIT